MASAEISGTLKSRIPRQKAEKVKVNLDFEVQLRAVTLCL